MNFVKNGLFNVLVYGCGLVVVNGLSFLMLPFYTRQFAPSEFALITLVISCLPFTRYCLPLEVCQAAPVFCADDSSKASHYVSMGLWFTLFMNLVCYSVIYLVNSIFHFVDMGTLKLLSLFVLFAVDCLFYFVSNILRWQLKPFTYNFIFSGVAVLEVVLTILFVVSFKLSLFGVFYSWMISRMLGFILIYTITRKYYAFIFSFNVLKKMLSFSIPLVLANIPNNLNRSFDRWIIARVIGLSAVGIYGAGSTIGGVINFIMTSVSAALSPIVYRNHERKEAPQEVLILFYLVLTVCMVIAVFFALFNKELLSFLVSKVYYIKLSEQPIVPFFVLSAILSGIYIFSPGLSIKRKTRHVIWFNIVSLLINTLLCIALISKWGIVGVAFATSSSVLANALLYMIFSQKYYPLPFKYNHVVPLVFVLFVFYIAAVWLGIKCSPFTANSVAIRILFGLVLCMLSGSLVWKASKEISNRDEMAVCVG